MSSSAAPGWAGGDEASLRAWLEAHGVRLDAWGTGTAKTTHDLHKEVLEGETTLLVRDGKPLRQLSMCVPRLLRACAPRLGSRASRPCSVQLRVRDARGRTLVEAAQALPDGRVRRRGVLLSEKRVGSEA